MGMIHRVAVVLVCAAAAGCTSKTGSGQVTPGGAGDSASSSGWMSPAPSNGSPLPRSSDGPAVLGFRKVAVTEPAPAKGNPTPPGSVPQAEVDKAKAARQRIDLADAAALRAAFDQLDCTAPDPLHGNDDPALPLITCDPTLPAKYALGPAFLTGTDVESAHAEPSQQGGGWVIALTFRPAGARAWADFTTKNVNQQVAVVVDTRVLSAPTIQEAILGGSTIINGGSGGFTKQEAEDLAGKLGSR